MIRRLGNCQQGQTVAMQSRRYWFRNNNISSRQFLSIVAASALSAAIAAR